MHLSAAPLEYISLCLLGLSANQPIIFFSHNKSAPAPATYFCFIDLRLVRMCACEKLKKQFFASTVMSTCAHLLHEQYIQNAYSPAQYHTSPQIIRPLKRRKDKAKQELLAYIKVTICNHYI